MPELPEVEISCRGLEPWIVGQVILRTEVYNLKLRWPIDKKIITLRNSRVLSVQRRAKYLLLEIDKGWIIIHFGMSGNLRLLPHLYPPEKHDHIDLIISNGYLVRYTDQRRFGSLLWSDNSPTSHILSYLGPEPLGNKFDGRWLYEKTRNKRTSIKSCLMNNKIVVGIGNIYANESLFISCILPNRTADSISQEEAELLSKNIKTLLLSSIEYGGTTLRNYLQPDGKLGLFMQKLQVYGRAQKPCKICRTPIKVFKHNQRSTFFCPYCQH